MTPWQAARRILCIRLDNMGDVLMTTPALQALSEAHRNREITLLTSNPSRALAPHLPMVDEVLGWDAPWVKHAHVPATQAIAARLDGCARQLAARAFDAAVIFTVYSQSALPAAMLCCLAGIPLRLAHCRENPYALLTDRVPDTEPAQRPRHEVQRQLDLVASVGARTTDTRMRFAVLERDRAHLHARYPELAELRSRGPLVVVHPGATAASRRWPPQRFAEVARELATHAAAHVFVTGTAPEAELVAAVCAAAGHPGVRPMAGNLSLGEMGALIEAASLLVSNNSGPVHLAAAIGTPVVDLYALTNPQHTPWQVPHRTLFADVPCRNCYKSVCPEGHHRCLRDVPAAAAVAAAVSLLSGDPGPAPRDMPWETSTPAAEAPTVHSIALSAQHGHRADIHQTPVEEEADVHAWH